MHETIAVVDKMHNTGKIQIAGILQALKQQKLKCNQQIRNEVNKNKML